MRVCIVTPFFTPFVRGNEYGLAESLSKLGHDVCILTSRSRAPREVGVVRKLDLRFDVRYLPTIPLGEWPVVPSIVRHIGEFDVAMLQEDYPSICHLAFLAAKRKGIPAVVSTERTYYPGGAKAIALRVLDATINRILREKCDLYTAHCTAAKNFAQRRLKVRRDIKVIHVGVDTALFRPLPPKGMLEGGYKILCVARLHKYKGLDVLLHAMKIVSERHPESMLYILGRGPEERRLKKLISDLRLENVRFLNPVPNERMPEIYAECDVYVQPSIIEPYGIAVLEAMACGKPVVGTRVGGMLDTISDGATGFLVNPGDFRELADKIILLRSEEVRERISRKAREWVLSKFDWMKIAEKYEEEIYRLLNRCPASLNSS